jgi:hypothetical protein
MVVQMNKTVSIPSVMRQIALDVRQNSWPIYHEGRFGAWNPALFHIVERDSHTNRVFAGSVPTTSEMQKALIFNDNGLEPTPGLRLEISKVRKTGFFPLLY